MQLGFSFRPGMGGVELTEPVEIIMASAVISSWEPSAFLTLSFLGAVKAAFPSMTVTLFIFSRLLTPPVSFLEMSFLWAMTWGKSTSTPVTFTPMSLP